MQKIIITIDGYAGSGKSSTAKTVAKALGYRYVDSGAMYRAVTLYFQENYVSLTEPKSITNALAHINLQFIYNSNNEVNEIYLNGTNVEAKIREMDIVEKVSQVSALSKVREAMVSLQRKMGKDKGIVMDGRDIGTTVFPEAALKLFMTADIDVRAERRQQELMRKDQLIDFESIKERLRKRDHLDETRENSPLKKATDAIELDTTYMLFAEQAEKVLSLAVSKVIEVSR